MPCAPLPGRESEAPFCPVWLATITLRTALVAVWLAVLLGAAVDQGGFLFAKAFHGKGWARAVAQQPLQCGAVVRLGGTLSLRNASC